MAKPVLSSVNVFDATEGVIAFFKIYVSYTSPNIIKEYEYSIYDGSDDKVICTSSGAYSNLSYTYLPYRTISESRRKLLFANSY